MNDYKKQLQTDLEQNRDGEKLLHAEALNKKSWYMHRANKVLVDFNLLSSRRVDKGSDMLFIVDISARSVKAQAHMHC